jgi:hypothetical protein
MVEKPISGDEEQRRAQTRAAREQSGLPPEPEEQPEQERPREEADRKRD